MNTQEIKNKLDEIRTEIQAERVSYGELAELRELAEYIENDDVELLEWAGVPEGIYIREYVSAPGVICEYKNCKQEVYFIQVKNDSDEAYYNGKLRCGFHKITI